MLSRKGWYNLILFGVVVVLGLLAYLEPGHEKPVGQASLTALLARDIDRIGIHAGTNAAITLRLIDDEWIVTEPVHVGADAARVEAILSLLQAPTYARFEKRGRLLAEFGLDQPAGRVSMNDLIIDFGGTEPLQHRRYVMVDDYIYLINDRYFYQSQLLLTALVDHDLLDRTVLVDKDVSLSRVVLPGIDVNKASILADYSDDEINQFINRWQHAQAVRLSRYDHETPEGTITLWLDNGQSLSFDLLVVGPELVLGRKAIGMRYHFSDEQSQQLLNITRNADTAGNQGMTQSDMRDVSK